MQTNGAFFKVMSYPKVGFPQGFNGSIYTKHVMPSYSKSLGVPKGFSYSGRRSKYTLQ